MKWTTAQQDAIDAVKRWADQCHNEIARKQPLTKQVFRLLGFAGTGKSTIAEACAADMDKVVYGAYTGKAATVMRSKGCAGANTLHSLIYATKVDEETGALSFNLSDDSPVGRADLNVVDECSMVDKSLGQDFLSFGRPVLVLGDPFQLPPVVNEAQIANGTAPGFFTEGTPDVMLTEIHRQAAGNPILKLATDIREGRNLKFGNYGSARVVDKAQESKGSMQAMVMAADQVLVGKNITKDQYNTRIRELHGATNHMPVPGDRVVCTANDKRTGVFNGGLFVVEEVWPPKRGRAADGEIKMEVKSLDLADAPSVKVRCRVECFKGGIKNLPYEARRGLQEFDFGYALTVHKSQGSQWPSVTLFNESATFRTEARRWLYTGITRAAETLNIVT